METQTHERTRDDVRVIDLTETDAARPPVDERRRSPVAYAGAPSPMLANPRRTRVA